MADPFERPHLPIEDYGIIGDLHTVALISLDGSIDFMCFPAFDSPTLFSALIDRRKGGFFQIAPLLDSPRHKQFYLPDTNVLVTRFLAPDGIAELTDFMPVEEPFTHNVVRRVKSVGGRLRYRMRCAPRFDYARAEHRVERTSDGVIFESQGPDRLALRLRAACEMRIVNGAAVAEFELGADQQLAFVLEAIEGPDAQPSQDPAYALRAFDDTVAFWRSWIEGCTYQGHWLDAVRRSALLLKLLVSRRHGSMIAAPTFGLPEHVGGPRNWDYRYTWIRDASFIVYALNRVGLREESTRFFSWVEERCQELEPGESLSTMYAVDGRRKLPEQVLEHLEGYRGSRPVRIGNEAHRQLQLDIYGELLDAAYLQDKYQEPLHHDLWTHLVRLLDWLEGNWNQPDAGIWEVRGEAQHFLYSRLMTWVAFDRALRIAHRRSLPAPVERWRTLRDHIHASIYADFWSERQRAFVQHANGHVVDASALIMPLVRFISPTDRCWLSTLSAIERQLLEDSMVYRYDVDAAADDGLGTKEGTFTMCSFWYVECLSRAGDLVSARLHFEKILSHSNHLGLYAEQLGSCGEHLGNFPQAFTHIALISTAYDLERRLRGWPRKA